MVRFSETPVNESPSALGHARVSPDQDHPSETCLDVPVTVAICTFNRCALLAKTLGSLSAAAVPESQDWEVLVVDNGSTDETGDTVAGFSDRLPVRMVREENAGHSHARNAAVLHAHGHYLIWTDDDVLVERDWLTAYLAAFARWPDAALFGGPIRPWFEGEPPGWLEGGLHVISDAYALRDLSSRPMPIDQDNLPYGANFAVRMKEQREFPFDPALGRGPDSMMSGEETTVMGEMLAAGVQGRWIPSASVRHWIPATRQTTAYLRAYFQGFGEGWALRGGLGQTALLWGRPRWVWRSAVKAELEYRLRRYTSDSAKWLDALKRASILRGVLRYRQGHPHSRG